MIFFGVIHVAHVVYASDQQIWIIVTRNVTTALIARACVAVTVIFVFIVTRCCQVLPGVTRCFIIVGYVRAGVDAVA